MTVLITGNGIFPELPKYKNSFLPIGTYRN